MTTQRMRPESRDTVHAVANGIELAIAILQRLSGGDISTEVNGSLTNEETYRSLVGSTIRRKFDSITKGVK